MGLLILSVQGYSQRVVFKDDFNTTDSYYSELTKNATAKEYGANALTNGYLLKKWLYSWEYSYDGDWKQAFYVVPPDKDYMEQAGRSAHTGNYCLMANVEIPDTVKKYVVSFKQWKNDNDPVFFLLGSDKNGDGGIRWGYENQLPHTDQTVDSVFMRGALGNEVIPGMSYFRQWATHEIIVNIGRQEITWKINDKMIIFRQVKIDPGGYFGLSQHYERGTRYDDFSIIIY